MESISGYFADAAKRDKELDEARQIMALDAARIADLERILDALPCPAHGRCIPYVLDRIKKLAQESV